MAYLLVAGRSESSMSANRIASLLGLVALLAGNASPSLGALPGCREEIDRVSKMIDDKKANYTQSARAEARQHLAAARAQVGQPADCRKQVQEARQALRQGKQ
jgi:hypothetical protein